MTFLQAAINGNRIHPAVPKTPDQIVEDCVRAVRAGMHSVHVHCFNDNGEESIAPADCARVLRRLRTALPGIPVSLTTIESIETDPDRRLSIVKSWEEFPDFITANQGEAGITELSRWFLSKGVGLEACVLTAEDARLFVASPLRDLCTRVLVEAMDPDIANALRDIEEMEHIILAAGVKVPQFHHGYDTSCWPVFERALKRGHGLRTGFEDVQTLPDGTIAGSNEELCVATVKLVARHAGGDG